MSCVPDGSAGCVGAVVASRTAEVGQRDDTALQSPSVLVVEDDDAIRVAVSRALQEEGYEVSAQADGSVVDDVTTQFRPDLAILDVRLPRPPDGYGIARLLRGRSNLPILFLTAAAGEDDRLAGFAAGADDYMVKPFSMAELLARVRALLRRSGRLASGARRIGDLVLDDTASVALRAGVLLPLTHTEYELLSLLTRQPGTVFSKVQIMNKVWGFESYESNLVEAHICALRQKLEAHGPRLIHTQRGAGYAFRA